MSEFSKFTFLNENYIRAVVTGTIVEGGTIETDTGSYTRRAIIDGDTIRVEYNGDTHNIRLAGISAPELNKFDMFVHNTDDQLTENEYAYTADVSDIIPQSAAKPMEYMQNMGIVPGAEVRVMFAGTGVFSRQLALLFTVDGSGQADRCINYDLMNAGLVSAYHSLPLVINADIWNDIANSRKEDSPAAEAEYEILQKYEDYLDEARDIESDDDLDDGDGKDLIGMCKIGLTYLPLSAENITVIEQDGTEEIPTIRTPGNPVKKSGHLNKRIEIVAQFPSLRYINDKLRVLLAQFIRSPFLPIENRHIRRMILDEVIASKITRTDADSYKDVKSIHELDMDKSKVSHNMPGLYRAAVLQRQDEYNDLLTQFNEEKDASEKQKIKQKIDNLPTNEEIILQFIRDGKYKQYYEDIEEKEELLLMCSLEEVNVSTTPGTVDNLQLSLVLDIFNYSAYVDKVRYCEDHKTALKQALYYDNLHKFKYPDQARDQTKYSSSNMDVNLMRYTTDLSKCSPFKDYIRPLLTGRPIYHEVNDIEMLVEGQTDPVMLDADYTMWPPENWLRPVSDENEFNNFHWKIDVTSLDLLDRINLMKQLTSYQSQIDIILSELSKKIVIPEAGKGFPNSYQEIRYLLDQFFHGIQTAYNVVTGKGKFYKNIFSIIKQSTEGQRGFLNLDYSIAMLNEKDKQTYKCEECGYEFKPDSKKKSRSFEISTTQSTAVPRSLDNRIGCQAEGCTGLAKPIDYKMVLRKNTPISISKLYEFFVNLEANVDGTTYSGKDLMRLLKLRDKDEEHIRYGNTKTYDFRFNTDREDLIVSGMSAAMRTRTATIPLESHFAPTKQYMGRSNWTVNVNFQTCSEKFLTILSTLSKNSSLSNTYRQKTGDRRFSTHVQALELPADFGANGFFKMLGINKALFESFEYSTMPDRPGWWNISVRLTQADMSLQDHEKLLSWNAMYDQGTLEKAINLFMRNYTPNASSLDNPAVAYIMDSMRNSGLQFLFDIGYGRVSPRIPDGLIQKEGDWRTAWDPGYIQSWMGLPRGGVVGSVSQVAQGVADNIPKFGYLLGTGRTDLQKTLAFQLSSDPESVLVEDSVLSKIYAAMSKAKKDNNQGDIISDQEIQREIFDLYFKPLLIRLGLADESTGPDFMAFADLVKIFVKAGKFPLSDVVLGQITSSAIGNIPARRVIDRWRDVAYFSEISNTLNDRFERIFNNFINLGGIGRGLPFKTLSEVSNLRPMFQTVLRLYVKQVIVKAMQYDRKGILEYLSSKNSDIDWEEQLFDMSSGNYIGSPQAARLYGCYADLEIPFSTGPLVLPADFYYIKPENFGTSTIFEEQNRELMHYIFKQKREQSKYLNKIKGIDLLINAGYSAEDLMDKYIFSSEKGWFDKYSPFKEKNLRKLLEELREGKAEYADDPEEILKKLKDLRGRLEDVFGSEWRYSDVESQITSDYKEFLKYANQSNQTPLVKKNIEACNAAYELLNLSSEVEAVRAQKRNNPADVSQKGVDLERKWVKALHAFSSFEDMDSSFIDNFGVYSLYSLEETEQIYSKSISQFNTFRSRDRTLHLGRAFPAFKVFFVEEDGKEWGMLDDYYMYNAVESIDVVYGKGSASKIATVTLSNITGNLTDRNAVFDTENLMADSTRQEQHLYSMLLREGTIIMINAGYDNNPARLDHLFIGKVVSVQPGDRMTIVAQSFGADLHEKVLGGATRKFGALNTPRTHGDVLIECVAGMNGLTNFGNRSIWEHIGFTNRSESLGYYVSNKSKLHNALLGLFPVIDAHFSFNTFDPRFENIYLPYTSKTPTWGGRIKDFFREWFVNDIKNGNKVMGWTFDWIVSNQSLWELMNEMALYRPNYIVTTLPYNENVPGMVRETLYMGPKNGVYRYTDVYDYTEQTPQIEKISNRSRINSKKRRTLYNMFNLKPLANIPPYIEYISGRIIKSLDLVEKKRQQFSSERGNIKEAGQMHARVNIIRNKMAHPNVNSQSQDYFNHFKFDTENMPNDLKDFLRDSKNILGSDLKRNINNLSNTISQLDIYLDSIENLVERINQYESDYGKLINLPKTREERVQKLGMLEDIVLNLDNPSDMYKKVEREPASNSGLPYEFKRSSDYDYVLEDGYTTVQNYHYVDSIHHIIKNDIRASAEDMYNQVILRYHADPKETGQGADKSAEFLADDDVKKIRSYVSTQRNIDPPDILGFTNYSLFSMGSWKWGFPTEAIVGYNILANVMRPMYRGELVIIGNPNIKPYDVIFVNDFENDMFGPIEVDEVRHTMNEEGFVTVITPHAIVEPLDPAMRYEVEAKQNFFSLQFGRNLMSLGGSLLTSAAVFGATQGALRMAQSGAQALSSSKYLQDMSAWRRLLLDQPVLKNISKAGVKMNLFRPRDWSRLYQPASNLSTAAGQLGSKLNAAGINKASGIAAGITQLGFLPDGNPGSQLHWALNAGVGIGSGVGLAIAPAVFAPLVVGVGFGALTFGSSLVDWTIGKMIGRECVEVVGLWYKGEPFVAGLEGMRKNTMQAHWRGRVANAVHYLTQLL